MIPSDLKKHLYRITTPPIELPVSLEEVKKHLGLTITTSDQDDVINLLIGAAVEFAECYTSIDFIKRDYETLRDYFENSIKVERFKLNSVSSVEYLDKDNAWIIIDAGDYYKSDNGGFDNINIDCFKCWPMDKSCRESSIRIRFNSGLYDDAASVDPSVKTALLNHIAAMFTDRGDCGCDPESCLPCTSKLLYDKIKVIS